MDVEEMLRDALGCRVKRTTTRMKIQPLELPTAGSQVRKRSVSQWACLSETLVDVY